jgi:hypothetical protein
MRRFTVSVVLAFAILVMLAPPGFAQAPAPKVTISGLFDQVTSMGRNTYDGNFTRNSDSEWYGRTRFRPDFEFAVGRVKAVLGLEIDLQYGQSGTNDGGFPGNTSGSAGGFGAGASGGRAGQTPPGCKVNTNGCLDINTDVGGMIEIKWVYTEFPLTGKDSLLPFIPVETMARAGGQPFDTLAQYKLAQYANGDFAGVSAITTFTPNIKTNLAYVIIEDQLAGANRGLAAAKTGRGEDWAFIFSPEFTPTKGLDIKPLLSYIHVDGQTSGTVRRNLANVGTVGGTLNGNSARSQVGNPNGDPTYHENRYTIGADARWRIGGFGLDPTFYWQWGTVDSQAFVTGPGAAPGGAKKVTADMSAFLFDVIGSYQLGPLLLELRGAYSPGNKARDNLAKGIRYYQPLDTDGNYWAGGWTQFWASGVDYFNQGWAQTGGYVGYDRYGRGSIAARATYNLTPALSLYGVVHTFLTAESVDTNTGSQLASASGVGTPSRTTINQNSWASGDSNYLGTEVNLGMTWRFSANTAFDLVGGYLFAGDALDASECTNGAATCAPSLARKKSAQDAYTLAARVRLAF